MTLRGKAAVVGIGEVPTRRLLEGRTLYGLCAEAARMAITDAGLRKQDIDGLVTDGGAALATMAEYIDIKPNFATGVSMQGASGASATTVAASAINAGMCETVLVVMGNSRSSGPAGGGASVRSEWEEPYGMAPGAGTGYALIYNRHMYEYGTTQEQMAKVASDQRFNAEQNPNAVFNGQPASVQDVLNSQVRQLPAAPARVRHAMRRGGRAGDNDSRARQVTPEPTGIPARIGHGAVQRQYLADRQDHHHARRDQREAGIHDGGVRSGGHAVRRVLRLIHHPRGREPRRCRIRSKGRDWPVLRVHRYDLQGHFPRKHRRRSAIGRPARTCRRVQTRH